MGRLRGGGCRSVRPGAPIDMFCARGTWSGIDAALANRIAKHSHSGVGLMGATSIPTHVPVAAVYQLAEYEQTVTTIARMRKIDLNFRDLELEVRGAHCRPCCGTHTHPDKAKRRVTQ